ncbi:TonB-dependent receptor plug [Emticicia oligotrophica DSM 17448]|uniref:TonB-dependent receptor plug n=1 Tax=Emticicia oligotrophica (strain DSM 17448 / CIP 109782 / MTCC 6937 / GPTSA100-15) TaxID=929562 RepID=A0ABN4APW6_EMTOG|nr:TonB-dependent receptor [Emticicia oligotrophica]AFK04495.1 TonB-dependent receptor plug [Emticicia oligotrophica DSM 17448]
MFRRFFKIVFLVCIGFGVSAQSNTKTTPLASQVIRGKVIDYVSERAVVGASITLKDARKGTQTDPEGNFSLGKMPIGRYQIQVSSVGYESQTISELLLESGKEMVLEVRLRPSANQLAEAVVRAPSANLSGAVTSIQNISTEQIFRYPGTYLDPARLATAYAGVANSNDQANGMIIRGNSPNGMQWRLEGVEIVNPNHLSNAGTFSDRITQNSGGVNILSAQLLGNMNFLTGAFPAEYGNALSGVMDLRLRKGNDKKHEFTAQAGLIGIDLAAEGPMGKKGASYLVNYRYSFTGLLAAMGVKFGGEDIRFQDLSFNLNFPTKKAGNFTIFGMGGLSSNVFEAVRDTTQWLVQKDGFDIYFKNKMGAAGLTHSLSLGKKLLWRTVVATSGLKNSREGYVLSKVNFQRFLNQADSSIKTKSTFTTNLTYKFGEYSNLKVGVFVTRQYDELFARSTDKKSSGAAQGLVIQPYANLHLSLLPKLTANIGLHYLKYTFNQTKSIEPRVSVQYQITNNQTISAAYGLHSQLQQPEIYFALATPNSGFLGNATLDVTKSRHYVLSHQYSFKKGSYFKTELFYQQIFNVPTALFNPTFSTLNLIEDYTPEPLQNFGKGRNYGVEISYQQYLTNGFYALTNATLYNATYTNHDGIERNSRFNGKHIFNLTIGKEWSRSKDRTLGTSLRVVWLGGFYEREINQQASIENKRLIYKNADAFTVKQADYFRPDFRIYMKKSKEKYSRTLALDIQNVANYQNVSYSYYDILQNKIVQQYQMGLIPILSYRWEF